jgi:hypothetical protein
MAIFPSDLVQEMNSQLLLQDNRKIDRLEIRCYNYEDDQQRLKFFTGRVVDIAIPGGEARFVYDNLPRTAVGVSRREPAKRLQSALMSMPSPSWMGKPKVEHRQPAKVCAMAQFAL